MPQFIFTMKDLRKVTPQGKEILKGIWLSFYHGAKIGVLGANGAGKSTLLRIMAGRRQGLRRRGVPGRGHAHRLPAAGAAARPEEERARARRGGGRREARDPRRATKSSRRTTRTRPPTSSRGCRTRSTPQNLWELDRQLEIAMDALRLPPRRRRRHDALGRRAAPRRALPAPARASPTCCCSTSPRTTSTPSRSPGSSASCRSTRARSSRSRTTATSSTTWPAGSSSSTAAPASPGRATTPPGSSRRTKRLAQEEKEASARRRTLERELEWVRMAPRARQAKGKARLTRYEELLAEEQAAEKRDDEREIAIPPGPRLGDLVIEAKDLRKGYGDNLLIDDLDFILPRGGIVGVIGPNGAGKTTLFRMIVGQEKPDAGELKVGETVALSYVDQTRETLRGRAHGLGGDLGRRQGPASMVGKREVNSRAYAASLQLPRRRPAEEGEGPLGRRAQPAAPREAPEERRQRAAARRADQRPRRRHAARARGGAPRPSPAAPS